jgi:S-adenosylmethionine/arginine decarboxylase-like enzyme
MSVPTVSPAPTYVHLIADFEGVAEVQLRDLSLLSGLLIAAAGAVGLAALGTPVVRSLPQGGLSGVLLMHGSHVAIHTMPDRGLLLLDVLVPRALDPAKAQAVFARRLSAERILSEEKLRG